MKFFLDALATAAVIAIGGAVALIVGLPIAWEIDRRVMEWTDPYTYSEGIELDESHHLPSYEVTPADPAADYAEVRR